MAVASTQMSHEDESECVHDRWLVLNPTSGTATHVDRVRSLAAERGYRIEQTEGPGHAVELAEAAVEADADLVAAAGGDGTLNEVLRGLDAADGLDDVTLGVVPTGTENLFATNIDVTGIERAFAVLDTGERRRIDIGVAGETPFVMSCVAGLTAEASIATSSELKERFGSLAFAITGVQQAADFDGLHIDVSAVSKGEETRWAGEALGALVGNVRRFAKQGGQANVEDGLFEVVVIEQMPTSKAVAEAAAHRVFARDTEHVHRFQASQLTVDALDGEPINFSIDGEPHRDDHLVLHTRPKALQVCVGPDYEADPTDE
ncbi:lipid kinase, YegS/Rv2252/BmrU family [Halogranum rubrum]|uniref:Lipid kinase, YegS/Rv2252/BmrU family n=2 Tax=Halogranum rubrum TaxID=553466 RepID=A0A1I4E6X8_9EURY|nr:lipid kinase, YegS/Rv2252/BmrU family [Halogranum rubrum]